MESQIQQTVSNIPGNIVQYCATSDIRPDISPVEITKKFLEIAASCKLVSNNILVSGIFPCLQRSNAN